MAAPLAVLRTGILTGSWVTVVEGFTLLTGETLPLPTEVKDLQNTCADVVLTQILDMVQDYFYPTIHDNDESNDESAEPSPKMTEAELESFSKGIKSAKTPGPRAEMEWETEPLPKAEEPDFHIEHKGVGEQDVDPEKGRRARTLPMDTSKTTENRFAPDKTLAQEEAAESIALSKKFQGKSHRPQFKLVTCTCMKCGKKEMVHPDNAPKRSDTSDEANSYVCNGCIRK